MDDFQYFGLFIDEYTRGILQYRILSNLFGEKDKVFLDHCTLLHKSQIHNNPELYSYLNCHLGKHIKIKLVAIGMSNKAMAFKVEFYPTEVNMCANKIPYITIATFNGGKPVDSNYIRHWKDIESIEIITTLNKI